ncbi:MAG: glutamine--fructose-6-phosphate transaminase (isomerizing) [Alphaproteobacteria bacterium]|nr:glutamine--fructose-6-phosphate transaminase (isomerizing) [Alphaproteobacteria bacterium]
MCGIIGILGGEPAAPRLVDALKRLEYRGYDSAGVATLEGDKIERRRAPGKIRNLEAVLAETSLKGVNGIGHTRWATHGAPNEANAHPHKAGPVAIVHNGIIENFRDLRAELQDAGFHFESETDSEVIAALIADGVKRGRSPGDAMRDAVQRMRGAYAIAALFEGQDDLLVGARRGSPLVAGFGDGEVFLGSDAIAVAPFTSRIMYLEEGDVIELRRAGAEVTDAAGKRVTRSVKDVPAISGAIEKGNYRHFMQKEIFEQPESIGRTVALYVNPLHQAVELPEGKSVDFAGMRRLHIIACGTAHYAGRIAKYWFERYAGLPVECEVASEYRYRDPVIEKGDAALVISQSGETADTLAALRLCAQAGVTTLGVVNVPSSSMARECNVNLPTLAGPEIGVASTKAFTAQLTTLAALAILAGRQRGKLTREDEIELTGALLETPRLIADATKSEDQIIALAQKIAEARSAIYLGRDSFFPLALEAALKLKEISYIHAEGFASGELKHGPIALVDEYTPVVMIAPHDAIFEKALSNLQEVAARGGKVLLISDAAGLKAAGDTPWAKVEAPTCHGFVAPIVFAAPIQLLAYHVAVSKGTDVDQPRNLAKSVTVE